MGIDRNQLRRPLLSQLCWFVRLRWIAGLAVVTVALVDWSWLHWQPHVERILAMGAAILAYNAGLWAALSRAQYTHPTRNFLLGMSWAQIALDLGALTVLSASTGGAGSPLTGLFVLHMVFASLLLPRTMAYAGAILAMVLMAAGLWLIDQWPSSQEKALQTVGWAAALLLTVYVANNLTRALRRKSRRLARQNRRIVTMSRTLQRHQRQLVQQEKMVAMGQMAAGVAHEISNPLASMDSLLQLLLRKPERLTADSVHTLRQQVARIHQIVQQMTAFAHPDDTQWDTVSLNTIVQQALDMLKLDARLRRTAVEFIPTPDLAPQRLLPGAVQQVVVNLVLNALDAMADVPHPKLVIRTARVDGHTYIEITDNGHGIAPGNLPRLFEPFFTTKPVGKGTGLGLAISYSLIRRQSGHITVRSEPDKGATFTVRLPDTRGEAETSLAAGHSSATSGDSAHCHGAPDADNNRRR